MTAESYRLPSSPIPYAVLRRSDEFGIVELDLLPPPGRFWADQLSSAPSFEHGIQERAVQVIPSPVELLRGLPPGDNWTAATRRALNRLFAWFLIAEDPQRRLDAQEIVTLAHQASLVRHIVSEAGLDRVLIADEVGLGKTIEAGLIVRELLTSQPSLRILYLAPARLVRNVRKEFDKLGLGFRMWVAGDDNDGTLDDPRVIASIHRAAYEGNQRRVLEALPWDVLIVDECHHLSDWAKGGGSPVQKYSLVKRLIERQRSGGRLILMSGTPHQGHADRFENLVRLLNREGEGQEAVAGRVIYRTKDDVQDWAGRPLFPGRQVNPVRVVALGDRHRAWLRHIHEFYAGRELDPDVDRKRSSRGLAAGWRAAQALQWATSSPHAGLGYLVRQAIRARLDVSLPGLTEALSAIRPYRLGPPDEAVDALFARIMREVERQIRDADVDDIEDPEEAEAQWRPDPVALSRLLTEGVAVLTEAGDDKWRLIHDELLVPAGDEKVVLFAQPIETVTALARYLERATGQRPALIIGNQSNDERDRETESFWRIDGPRFLVSSRAGGEGINLQVARRLVHVDVPWNPMELEQRVGRVHRFGSRQTIIVDTVVVQESREVHAYDLARRKLHEIAKTLVPEDRFEALFARVMALVPPAEIQEVLSEGALSPLSGDEASRIAELVSEGFDRWRNFHARFGEQEQRLRQLDPGQATWDDVATFAEGQLAAVPIDGFSALSFAWTDGEVREASYRARVFSLKGTGAYACGDYGGIPVTDASGRRADQLGLNVPLAADALRRLALPVEPTGAAYLRWPDGVDLPRGAGARPFAVLVANRQTVRLNQGAVSEVGTTLNALVVPRSGIAQAVAGEERAELVRALQRGTIRRDPVPDPAFIERLLEVQQDWVLEMLRPSDADREDRLRHAVTLLLASIVD